MSTVRPRSPAARRTLYLQAARMRGRRHAAANHFQLVPASTARSLLLTKGPDPSREPPDEQSRPADDAPPPLTK